MYTSHRNFGKRAKTRYYYLNEHMSHVPRIRIESTRGGDRCLWRERTTLKKMQDTKRYLESVWHIQEGITNVSI